MLRVNAVLFGIWLMAGIGASIGPSCGCGGYTLRIDKPVRETRIAMDTVFEFVTQPSVTLPIAGFILSLLLYRIGHYKRYRRRDKIRKDREFRALKNGLEYEYIMRK